MPQLYILKTCIWLFLLVVWLLGGIESATGQGTDFTAAFRSDRTRTLPASGTLKIEAQMVGGRSQPLSIVPAFEGGAVWFEVLAHRLSCGTDRILVYDGPSTSAPLRAVIDCSTRDAIGPSLFNASGVLTLVYDLQVQNPDFYLKLNTETRCRQPILRAEPAGRLGPDAPLTLRVEDAPTRALRWQRFDPGTGRWLDAGRSNQPHIEVRAPAQSSIYRALWDCPLGETASHPLRIVIDGPQKGDAAELHNNPCAPPCTSCQIVAEAESQTLCQGETTELIATARIATTLEDDFDFGINTNLWLYTNGTPNTRCGLSPVFGDALHFNTGSDAARVAETRGFDLELACDLEFYIKIGNEVGDERDPLLNLGCEDADLPAENVLLQYSTDNGLSWTTLQTFDNGGPMPSVGPYDQWTHVCIPLPVQVKTRNTRLRWIQPSNSGVGRDQWAIDGVKLDITQLPQFAFYEWTPTTAMQPPSGMTRTVEVSPTQTTTYSVTGRFGSNSCSTSITVAVVPDPVAGTISGSTTMCPNACGHPLSLQGFSGNVRHWLYCDTLGYPCDTFPWPRPIPNTAGQSSIGLPCIANYMFRQPQIWVVVERPGCKTDTTVSITVREIRIGTIDPDEQSACRDDLSPLQNLTLVGSDCQPIEWQRAPCDGHQPGPWTSIGNPTFTQNPRLPTAPTDTVCFRVRLDCGTCGEFFTGPARVNIDDFALADSARSAIIDTVRGQRCDTVCLGSDRIAAMQYFGLPQNTRLTGTLHWQTSVSPNCDTNPAAATWEIIQVQQGFVIAYPPQQLGKRCFRMVGEHGECDPDTTKIHVIHTVECPDPPPAMPTIRTGVTCYNQKGRWFIDYPNTHHQFLGWEARVNGRWIPYRGTDRESDMDSIRQDSCLRVVFATKTCPTWIRHTNVACTTPTQRIFPGQTTADEVVCIGQNSGCVSLSGHSPPPLGQILYWERRQFRPLPNPCDPTICQTFCELCPRNAWTDWDSIPHTTSQLCYSNLDAFTEYRAVVGDGACQALRSLIVRINIDSTALAGTLVGNDTLCAGFTKELSVTGIRGNRIFWDESPGCTGSYTTVRNQGLSSFDRSDSWTTPPLTQTVCYRVRVRSGVCPEDTSNVVRINVIQIPIPGTTSGADTICRNQTAGPITLSGNDTPVERWEIDRGCIGDWVPLPNTFRLTAITTPSLTQTSCFRAVVGRTECERPSTDTRITVDAPTVAGIIVGDTTPVCNGGNREVLLTESTGQILRWEQTSDPNCATSWQTVPNSANQTLINFNSLTASLCVRVLLKSGICSADTTATFRIRVGNASRGGTVTGPNTDICANNDGGTLTLSNHFREVIRWEYSTNCPAFTNPIPIANTTTSLAVGVLSQTRC